MNGNASVSTYIYILAAVAHWFRHWPVMTEVVGSSPVVGHFLFLFVFLTGKQTCKLEFMGFMIKVV